MKLNPYILCVMDHNKNKPFSVVELEDNRANAAIAVNDAARACDAARAAYTASREVANTDGRPPAYADSKEEAAEYWIGRYFEHTGENREDYENKLKEDSKK